MNNLVIKNLTVRYPFGAEAIANFSLSCNNNAVMTIFGGAESGKTTLLKAIAGLLPASSGSIVVSGKDITNFKCKDRNITLLYNEYGLFDKKSVQQNLLFPLKIRKIDKAKSIDIVDKIMQKHDLINKSQEKVKKLDDIQKIAVVFARAKVRDASIYLIDNIFANIKDNESRQQVFSKFLPQIQDLCQNACVIFATDSKYEAQVLGENITVLNYGITLQHGSFDDIVASPMSLFVAKLFALDNLKVYQTQIVKQDKQIFVETPKKLINLHKDKLINEIFVGKSVIVATYEDKDEKKIKIFDARSEQLIYFD